MKTKPYLSVITLLFILLVACGSNANVQNENLPEGMRSGYWAGTRGDADYYNVGLVFFENGYVTDGEGEFGKYTLMDDDNILLQTPDWSESLTVSMAKSDKRLLLGFDGRDDVVVDLVVPNTSSGDLEKDIKGTWEEYYELVSLDDDSGNGYLWDFKKNGTFVFSEEESGDEARGGTYEFIDDKIILEFDNGTRLIYSVFSIGDLVYLGNPEEQEGKFLLRQ